MITLAGFLTVYIFTLVQERYALGILRRPLKLYAFYASSIIYLLMLYILEMYAIRQRKERLYAFTTMAVTSFVSFLATFALAKVLRINQSTMVALFAFYLICVFFLYFWRRIFGKFFVESAYFIKKVLFIGRGFLTETILNDMPKAEYEPIGFADTEIPESGSLEKNLKFVGITEDLGHLIDSQAIKVVVTALGKSLPLAVMKDIYKYKFKGIEVYNSAYFYEVLTRKVAVKQFLESDLAPFLSIDTFVNPVFRNIKRLTDFFGALLVLMLISPLFALISFLVRLTSGSPVFYLQERLGFQEKAFRLIKFRTMVVGAEAEEGPQWASKDDSRVTGLGKFLRKARLDELPQLINILKGDISFVGPRPIRKHFASLVEKELPFYSLRFTVKPGLTGWAQVHYEYGGTVEGHMEKFQYDLYYIKHASLFLDLFIVLKTLQTLIRRPAY